MLVNPPPPTPPSLPSAARCVCCQLAANYAASRLRIRPVRTPQKAKAQLVEVFEFASISPAPHRYLSRSLPLSPSLSFFLSLFSFLAFLLAVTYFTLAPSHMLNSLPV